MNTFPPLRAPSPSRVTPAAQLLSLDEAAARLAFRPRTLREWAARGDLRYVRIGRALRFEESALAAFIAQHRMG